MGAINLLVDATSESPVLPVRSLVAICGGGDIQRNDHVAALYDYDATLDGMRRIVEALFFDPSYAKDDGYVRRRYESSIAPGAWESMAAARFRRPGLEAPSTPSSARAYDRITVPTLVVAGQGDKLLPQGWAAEIAGQIAEGRSAVVEDAGHCPQIEQPEAVNALLLDFFEGMVHMTELDRQGRDRHRRRVGSRRGAGTTVRRRGRQGGVRRRRQRQR